MNLYGDNKLNTKLLDRSALRLRQDTQYPWDGSVRITLEACKSEPFEIRLRIPEWAEGSAVRINGKDSGTRVEPGSFAVIKRRWKADDVVELNMPMDETVKN